MDEKVEAIILLAETKMSDSLNHLELELGKIRASRANTSLLDTVMIDYYGNQTAIANAASLSTPDARTIIIQPWEKNLVPEIISAVNNANLGLSPQDTGEKIIINIPVLTEERRKELVKQAKSEVENCKVSLRSIRRDSNEALKKLNKIGLSDDELRSSEDRIQTLTNNNTNTAESIFLNKEKDILTV